MNILSKYTIIIRPDDNDTYVAYLPAISGCHAYGNTPEEARQELNNVFEMIQEEYKEESKVLPKDIEVVLANAS
jgi:predicted RNase H-like HicB family nuclease